MVNKIDLLSYLDFKLECFYINLRNVNPDVEVIELSVKTGEGLDRWCQWLTTILK